MPSDSYHNMLPPDPPRIDANDLQRCRETGDYSTVFFEWYKYVASLSVIFANLKQDTASVRKDISKRDYGILIGLLNRCARIMLANVALSHKGEFGESTMILDRCIFESCVILSWLCKSINIEDRFDRYLASGLKTEIELRDQVQKAVSARDGKKLNIEYRMLETVKGCLAEAGFNEEKIKNTKEMPDMASMLDSLGQPRFAYTAGQRVSSHHVHGTWIGLRNHYIELADDGSYNTKQFSPTHVNQYVYIAFSVLDALACFVNFVFESSEDEKNTIIRFFREVFDEISSVNNQMIRSDYEYHNVES
jgi:hypothetical protein